MTEGLYSCIEVARTDNPVPAFSVAMSYWEKKRDTRFAPSWSDIELLDLPTSVIPNCIVLDVGGDLLASRYRFYGSAVGDVHGMELSNRTIGDVKPAAFREHILFQYQTVVEVREPRLFATLITVRSGARRRLYILRMPLSDDGDGVTNIFSIQDANDDREELIDYFSTMGESSNGRGGEAQTPMTGFLDRDAAKKMAADITILEASIDRAAPSPSFSEFKDHWDRVRGVRWAPSWRDFDPVDFHHLWRNLVLWDVVGDVYDFRVRMAGVEAVEFFGNDPTGQSIRDESFTPPHLFDQFYLFHKLSALWPGPVWFTGTMWYWKDRNHVPIQCMTLPLSDGDDRTTQTVNLWSFEQPA